MMYEIPAHQKSVLYKELSPGDEDLEYGIGAHADVTLVFLLRQSLDTRLTIRLADSGSTVRIIGFVVGQHIDTIRLHTVQLHDAPETTSNLLIKSILGGQSEFFYDGAIRVESGAQKTDAYQRNENILVSQDAQAHTKPALEILANDVRCTHGATVGVLSEDALWYLATRGIEESLGRQLLIRGFFESAVNTMGDTNIQDVVRKELWQNT